MEVLWLILASSILFEVLCRHFLSIALFGILYRKFRYNVPLTGNIWKVCVQLIVRLHKFRLRVVIVNECVKTS